MAVRHLRQLEIESEVTDAKPGTLANWSPEAFKGWHNPLASDCYAVGATFWDLGHEFLHQQDVEELGIEAPYLSSVFASVDHLLLPASQRYSMASMLEVLAAHATQEPVDHMSFLRSVKPRAQENFLNGCALAFWC